jgi:protease PrsW
MKVAISLALALLPSLAIVLYVRRMDRLKPEPRKAVSAIFLFGVLSTVPAIAAELLLSRIFRPLSASALMAPFIKAFLVAGVVEEGLKLSIVMRFSFNREWFDEIMDGILFAVVAGMGFACLENVLYVMGRGMGTAVLRALTSVPMHGAVSVVMGYYIGVARFCTHRQSRRLMLIKGYLLAVFFHGLYNLCIFSIPFWTPLTVLGLPLVLLWVLLLARRLMKRALSADVSQGRVSIRGFTEG